MVYIVLPPELSKRSITTLIQYMYSGEATVSNDILNEVLRGGEVLKVRGLWRNNQTSEPNASSTPAHCPPAHKSDQCTKDPHQIIAEKPIYEHRIPPISSVVTESPVIVMSSQQHQQSNKSMQNIAANREMINNEPIETAAIPTSHYGLVSLQIAAAVKKAQQNSEKRVKSVSVYPKNLNESVRRRYSDDQSKDIESGHIRVKEGEVLRMSDCRRSSNVSETNMDPVGDKLTMKYSSGPIIVDKKAPEHIPEALSFLTIKQEPTEWSDYEQENGIVEKSQIEVTVKPEILYADEEPAESEEGE